MDQSQHLRCSLLRDTVLRFYEQFSYEPCLHPKHPKCLYSTFLSITPAEDAAEIHTEQLKKKKKNKGYI